MRFWSYCFVIAILWSDAVSGSILVDKVQLSELNDLKENDLYYNIKSLINFCARRNGIFPHPTDCTSSIKCSQGIATIHPCPTGQFFNSRQMLCKTEAFPSCKERNHFCLYSREIMTSRTTENRNNTEDTFKEDTFKEDEKNEKFSNQFSFASSITEDESFTCPESNGRWPIVDNCEQFHVCIDDEAFLVTCDNDLEYDVLLRKCVPSKLAHCAAADPKCTDDGIFRVGTLCDRYAVCCNGASLIEYCKPGMAFDVDLLRCTWVNSAECS